MKNLTEDERIKITLETIKDQPLETVGQLALLRISELAISMNSAKSTLSTEATFDGKRYKCEMVVTQTLI